MYDNFYCENAGLYLDINLKINDSEFKICMDRNRSLRSQVYIFLIRGFIVDISLNFLQLHNIQRGIYIHIYKTCEMKYELIGDHRTR